MNGGAGGFTTGVLNLTGDTTATVIVGGGGQPACWNHGEVRGSLTPSYGGGGTSVAQPTGLSDNYYCGASGGGRSAVRVGAGVANGSVARRGAHGRRWRRHVRRHLVSTSRLAAVAERPARPAPAPAQRRTFCGTAVGGGGTQTAGGAAGTFGHWGPAGPFSTPPTAGTQFQGGNGGCGDSKPGTECGGGGGGGYFGGGGGGEEINPTDSPGGGGSGHVDGTAVTGGTTTASANYIPPGTAQTQYVAGVGVGGGPGTVNVGSGDDNPTPGGNGLAVFEFAKLPTLTIAKTTLGAVGTFNFTGTNGIAATAITTVTAGTTVLGSVQTLTNPSTATSITEAAVPNWLLTTATCTGMGTGGTATLNAATGTLSLNAAATVDGSNIVCTFVNAKLPLVQLAKTLVNPTGTGNTFGFGVTGVNPTTDSVVGVAGSTVTSGTAHLGTIGTAVVVTENSTTGLPLTDYTSAMSCVDATGGNATITSATTAVTIPAAKMSANASWTCTATNTRKSTTLQMVKTWAANSKAGDTVTVTSSGFTNNATSGTSVATAAGNTTTGTAVTVYAGESGSVGETFSVGSAANYTSTLACTSGLSGSTLTVAPGVGPIVCTETNTRKSATLKLIKTWAPGSTAGNTVTVNSTGFVNNATSGSSVATAAGNSTTGTTVTVFAGESGTIGETFSVGSAANYAATLSCVGNTVALSGATLTVSPSDTAITCTETNTPHAATLKVVKVWAPNSKPGDTVTVASSGFPTDASSGSSVATAAGNTTTGSTVTVFAGDAGTIGETYSVGSAANYTTTLSCVGNAAPLVGNTLTVSPSDSAITCTETNTRKSATLKVAKTWAVNSKAGDKVTVTSSGLTNNATSGTSTATTAGNTTTGAAVTVFAGDSGTISEAFSVGSAANYVSTLACTGTSGLSGSTLTVGAADTAIVCTETNTRKSATLNLVKVWAPNSKPGDTVTVNSAGLTVNATSGTSVATSAGNTTTGTTIAVYAGDSGPITETFSVGSAANYASTLACTGNSVPLSGNTVTIAATDVGSSITCTETNTRKSATLTLVKSWGAGSTAGDTVSVSSSGFVNAASSGPSVATAAGNLTTGAAVTVFAGESGAIGETYSVGSAANYAATVSCVGNAVPLSGANLTISPSDTAITCTETNTPHVATLRVVKVWAPNSKPGDTVTVASSGFPTDATSGLSVATGAGNTTTGSAVMVFAGDSGTIGETYSVGSASNYVSTLACVGNTAPLVGNTLTVSPSDTAIVCTETNTRKSASLTLVKSWVVNSKAGDTVTVSSSGLTNNATSGPSVATSTGNATTGAAVTVFAGDSGSIAETFSVGTAANYVSTLTCAGTSGLSGSTLTVGAADTAIVCTETNTRKSATLKLVKTWAGNSKPGDTVTVNSVGLAVNATSGTSVATAAGNSTTGSTVAVYAGDSGSITEAFSVGSAANYTSSLACTGNSVPLSGNTVTIAAADVGASITCTETNVRKSATLTLVKSWGAGSTAGDTVTVDSSGFVNAASSGPSVATAAGNSTTGASATVFAGESGTIDETYSVGCGGELRRDPGLHWQRHRVELEHAHNQPVRYGDYVYGDEYAARGDVDDGEGVGGEQ